MREAVIALGALAQETRLAAYRLLVEAGPEGMPAGRIAEFLEIAPAALSFHLKEMSHARLISSRQQGRFIYYAADFEQMAALMTFLTQNCCKGMPHDSHGHGDGSCRLPAKRDETQAHQRKSVIPPRGGRIVVFGDNLWVGVTGTIVLWAISGGLAILIGLILAAGSLSPRRPIRVLARAIVNFTRGIPTSLFVIAAGIGTMHLITIADLPVIFPGTTAAFQDLAWALAFALALGSAGHLAEISVQPAPLSVPLGWRRRACSGCRIRGTPW